MASGTKVAAVFRSVLRSSQALRGAALRRAVAPGVAGAFAVGGGLLCYYRYHANNRTLPFSVHAEEENVSSTQCWHVTL